MLKFNFFFTVNVVKLSKFGSFEWCRKQDLGRVSMTMTYDMLELRSTVKLFCVFGSTTVAQLNRPTELLTWFQEGRFHKLNVQLISF